jgi:hypothetical protein
MTTQEKLTAIVGGMIDGGWKDKPDFNSLQLESVYEYDYMTTMICLSGLHGSGGTSYARCIQQLIFNADAMRAAYGEELVCKICGGTRKAIYVCVFCQPKVTKSRIKRIFIPHHTYIGQQALKLAHEQGIPAAIDYLYGVLPGVEK